MQKKRQGTDLKSQIASSGRIATEQAASCMSFAETLVRIMDSRKVSRSRLAIDSLVSETTLTRMRSSDDLAFNKQIVIAVCVGLALSPAEAFALLDKSCCKLRMSCAEDVAYFNVLCTCGQYSIDEVNYILEENGFHPLGGF